ncbi:Nitrile hydratase subunit beta [Jannaschia seosinensis]|uniref:Nitrile hydratase subunit beta n=1 Tax=Jannaschia seosinensis TaxID=313367 RepID=A0A0M7BA52_9RHOB|nr:SH3-like domain-containing protein [Jannaschia seosinensis]CUH29399.1 Nitrile hydratase subunit beta [Jannaschia seosinensis]
MDNLAPGTSVRVRAMRPPGHVRTPGYLRGRIGIVERALGPFPNPEQLAYGHAAARLPLYRVRFRMGDLWPSTETPDDTLDAEIYAHWLEPL